jgi:hypothetical protein
MHLHCAPRLVARVADIFQRTFYALGLARNAQAASVPDDLVGEENPFFARDDVHQVLFDFLRVGVRG